MLFAVNICPKPMSPYAIRRRGSMITEFAAPYRRRFLSAATLVGKDMAATAGRVCRYALLPIMVARR